MNLKKNRRRSSGSREGRAAVGLVMSIVLILLAAVGGMDTLAAHPGDGDVHETRDASEDCPETGTFLPCSADAFISVEHVEGDCQQSGCYVTLTCIGTARGTLTVTGETTCGAVDVSGNVDPTVGSQPCSSAGIALIEATCSMHVFGTTYIFNGSCQDLSAEVVAVSPAGTAVARAGPVKTCSANGVVWVSD